VLFARRERRGGEKGRRTTAPRVQAGRSFHDAHAAHIEARIIMRQEVMTEDHHYTILYHHINANAVALPPHLTT